MTQALLLIGFSPDFYERQTTDDLLIHTMSCILDILAVTHNLHAFLVKDKDGKLSETAHIGCTRDLPRNIPLSF